MSSRRQPLRQARTKPARAGTAQVQQEVDEIPKAAPGFFPGITYFTDATIALPKEMIRHFTLLKEVDAKIFGPEEHLKRLIATIPNSTANDPTDRARREHFLAGRITMNEMLGSLDEKNHVISTANESLSKWLARCESAWPLIEQEISEEARWGRLDHWAYTDRSVDKKPAANPERTTRRGELASASAAAAAAAAAEAEAASLRGDTRVGKGHRRGAQATNHDAETDPHGKKAQSHKRKPHDNTAAASGAGLGISQAGTQGHKKRKIEKPPPLAADTGLTMERSLSGVFGKGGRAAPGSPRDTTAASTSKKRATGASTGTGGRRRAGTVNSAVGSPMIASSPVVGTFALSGRGANSPAIGAPMVRSTSARARKNSTHVQQASKPPPPTSAPHTNGGVNALADSERVSRATHVKGDENQGPDARTSSRTNDRSIKREESTIGRHRPPSISTATRTNGKASKNATPMTSSFPENSRPRSGRSSIPTANSVDLPPKRSHKKKEPAPQRQRSNNKSTSSKSKDGDEGSPMDDDDEEEQRYCYCNGISYGEMVACDKDGCKREWFHLDCVGLTKLPNAKTKWYCNECRPLVEQQKPMVEAR